MKKQGLYFVTFICGAAIGSAVTWLIAKNRFAEQAQQEIDSVKEYYSRKEKKIAPEASDEKQKKVYTEEVASKIRQYSGGFESVQIDRPYIISPEDFGELEDYAQVSLTYYSNGVLVDDVGDLVEDVEETVGDDFADRFGEYEDDVVYVRNDARFCDYEILYDSRKYVDPDRTIMEE